MTTFNDREKGFENKFAHDAEMQFRAHARTNKMLGLWAASLLGKTGGGRRTPTPWRWSRPTSPRPARRTSTASSRRTSTTAPTSMTIRAKMTEFLAQAKAQLFNETS